jgi:hypothetical protein
MGQIEPGGVAPGWPSSDLSAPNSWQDAPCTRGRRVLSCPGDPHVAVSIGHTQGTSSAAAHKQQQKRQHRHAQRAAAAGNSKLHV